MTAQSYLSSVARHNEVLAVTLNDPLERELPPPGRYRLLARDDEELAIDTYANAARKAYSQAYGDRVQAFDAFCHRYGIHVMPMSTEDDPVTALQSALGRRTH